MGIGIVYANSEVVDLSSYGAASGQAAVAPFDWPQADEAAIWKIECIGIAEDIAAAW